MVRFADVTRYSQRSVRLLPLYCIYERPVAIYAHFESDCQTPMCVYTELRIVNLKLVEVERNYWPGEPRVAAALPDRTSGLRIRRATLYTLYIALDVL